jgi:hypothetical protein
MSSTEVSDKVYDGSAGAMFVAGHYGNRITGGEWSNITFTKSLSGVNRTYKYATSLARNFLNPEWQDFTDIDVLPEMMNKNSDLVLIQISANAVGYDGPVNDPLFSAHKTIFDGGITANRKKYTSDWPIQTMGCRQQYQYCVARANAPDFCTDLNALPGRIQEYFAGASEAQIAALRLLVTSNLLFDASDAFEQHGTEASRLLGAANFMAALPDDQWIREVVASEKFVWASMQTLVSDYAIGHAVRDPLVIESLKKNITKGERQLCGAQRMRKSGGFMNINVFGLAFIITFSFIVTALDLVLLKFLIFLRRFRRALAPRIDRWIQDGVFQLQRRAYEAKDGMAWECLEKEIPIPVNNELLDDLPIEMNRSVCTHECAKCSSSSISDESQGSIDQPHETADQPQTTTDQPQEATDELHATSEEFHGTTDEHDTTVESDTVSTAQLSDDGASAATQRVAA